MHLSPLTPALASAITAAIRAAAGNCFVLRRASAVSGGCIARALCIEDGATRYFVKLAGSAAMFAAEADGLAALARCDALVVPQVVARGTAGEAAFLVLDWLDLGAGDDARLGEALAALHAITLPRFGWSQDNFIGATPQVNGWLDDWISFFIARRLRPQLALAEERGAPALATQAAPVLAALPARFADVTPRASLLHGDLWSGNVGFVGGWPALFDPAVYAGDGESDLAMAALFGGFSPRFAAAYRAQRPAPPDAVPRRALYQLYHVLNHVSLFGGAYVRQASALLWQLAQP